MAGEWILTYLRKTINACPARIQIFFEVAQFIPAPEFSEILFPGGLPVPAAARQCRKFRNAFRVAATVFSQNGKAAFRLELFQCLCMEQFIAYPEMIPDFRLFLHFVGGRETQCFAGKFLQPFPVLTQKCGVERIDKETPRMNRPFRRIACRKERRNQRLPRSVEVPQVSGSAPCGMEDRQTGFSQSAILSRRSPRMFNAFQW